VGETGTLDVRELVELPDNLDINVFPNPFNSAVVISVETLHATSLHIEIFDINGRLIKRLGITNSEFIWRPEENIPSGIYHIRVRADNRELGKKVVYLK